jgi:hypothetical protein
MQNKSYCLFTTEDVVFHTTIDECQRRLELQQIQNHVDFVLKQMVAPHHDPNPFK